MSDQRVERVKALLIDRDTLRDRQRENDYKLKDILGDLVPVSWTDNGIHTEVQFSAAFGKITITTEGILA